MFGRARLGQGDMVNRDVFMGYFFIAAPTILFYNSYFVYI